MGKPLTFLVKRSALKFHVKTRILMVRWITAKLRLEANDEEVVKERLLWRAHNKKDNKGSQKS